MFIQFSLLLKLLSSHLIPHTTSHFTLGSGLRSLDSSSWSFRLFSASDLHFFPSPESQQDIPLCSFSLLCFPSALMRYDGHTKPQHIITVYNLLSVDRQIHLCYHHCCSVTKLCLNLCGPMDCSMPGLPVQHQLPNLARTDVHWVSEAIQPSHPLLPSSPPAFDLSQHQGLFQWVSSLNQVARVLELQLQHQSFQWIFRVDIL